MNVRKCLTCETPISGHFNRKRCEPCAALLLKKPAASLSSKQAAAVRRLAGKIPQDELAQRIGCSRSNLIRWASRNQISLDTHSYKPEVIADVCKFYELHGRKATEKRFPKVRVRSVVERYPEFFSPRQLRWTGKELMEAARMAGLVSLKAQAQWFNRPNANTGSISALWTKRFGYGGAGINGLCRNHARHISTTSLRYLKPKSTSRDGDTSESFRRVALWVDLENHLKDELPESIVLAVSAMADFQRWIWRSDTPKPKILKMMAEREVQND